MVVPVVEARVAARFDDGFRHTGGDVTITGEDGGTTALTIDRFAFFGFEAAPGRLLNEAGCTGAIDGVPAVAHFECGWDTEYAAGQASRGPAAA